jgi:hypothetical protein
LIGLESFDVHFHEANERAPVIRPLSTRTIHNHPHARDCATVRMDDIDCFLDPAAAGDHVFGHDKPLVRPDLKPTSQDQPARFFFDKDMAFAQGASDFLADNDPAEGGGDDRVALDLAKLGREPPANVRRNVRILEENGALKKLAAMQARAQDKMSIQQSARSSKECEQILAHLS